MELTDLASRLDSRARWYARQHGGLGGIKRAAAA